ncbi:MAG: PIN domain-containing protein [Acidimicrobiia bacterium]
MTDGVLWCADTSLVVAALSQWHAGHELSRQVVEERQPMLPAHVLLESYATLTRMPGHELAPEIAWQALDETFPRRHPSLQARMYRTLVARLAAADISGGRVYDALVGAAVKAAGATLATRDRRATAAYEVIGCPYELIAET